MKKPETEIVTFVIVSMSELHFKTANINKLNFCIWYLKERKKELTRDRPVTLEKGNTFSSHFASQN